MNLDNIRKKEK